jgi:sugar fermentation stimulation protein A
MRFEPPLKPSVLINRYKRFLADVEHPQFGEMTVHCPNTGSMKNCWQPGWTAWILDSNNPKRKYRYTWVVSENSNGERIGINTHLANQLVVEGIRRGVIRELSNYDEMKTEVPYGEEKSRIDVWLEDASGRECFVEVKNVTLKEDDGIGYFPDAVTKRGQKHLRELIQMKNSGHRAVLLFVVQHTGITSVKAAAHIDPDYARLLTDAIEAGVEVLAYTCEIEPDRIAISHQVEFI